MATYHRLPKTLITAAVISFYNDPSIFRCLSSIIDHFDYIIILDGKYEGNEAQNDYSDVLIQRELNSTSNVRLFHFSGTEEDKRNMYLKYCKAFGVTHMLIIDSDEYIIKNAKWDMFWENCKELKTGIYGIWVDYSGGWMPRLWVNPENFEYFGAHCLFRNKTTGEVTTSGTSAKTYINGIIMSSDDTLRSQEYLKNTFDYQVYMMEKEKEIRKQYSL